MGDELYISGSGSTSVATDELWASAEKLRDLSRAAISMQGELSSIDGLVSRSELSAMGAPPSAARAEQDMDQAAIVLVEIDVQAHFLQFMLNTAADGYSWVERFIGSLGQSLMDSAATAAGHVLPGVMLANPGATFGAAGALGALAQGVFTKENNGVITNPFTVALVRKMAMSSDNAAMAAAGIPDPLAGVLGDNGLGVTSVATSAAGVMVLGGTAGLFRETPVHLAAQTPQKIDSPPTGFADRLERVPHSEEGDDPGQVVIEKYEMPGQPDRFEVYVSGTVTFDPVSASEPWDMTSNMANAANIDSGSMKAVVSAMQAAGIDATSPVQITGYSQGGGTAAAVAASEQFNVVGVATFGGPTGNVLIPEGITTVIVEHTDDVVPATVGDQRNQQAVLVQREAFADRPIPTEYAVPAHHFEYYDETARKMDDAQSEALTDAADKLNSFTDGATSVTSTSYRFERG